MISGTGHDQTLDWWALGVLLYEMIIGVPPFFNKNKHQMYYLIQNAPIRWPEQERHGFSVSAEAQDLITRLLNKDRKKRLGCKADAAEVLSHPFFRSIDIAKLSIKQLEPPYIPKVMTDDELAKLSGEEVRESEVPLDQLNKIKGRKSEFDKFGFLSAS
jgi:serine/threonine protein kinase